jgi:hypothetical protein
MATDTYKGPEGERSSERQFSLRSNPSFDLLNQGDFGDILARLYTAMAARQAAFSPNPQSPAPDTTMSQMPQQLFGQSRPQLSPEQIEALAMQEAETQRQAIQAYSPQAQAEARRFMKDPYHAATSAAEAQRAWDYGTLSNYKALNQMPELTPAAKIAVQGPSAVNQWAQLGAYQGIDPAEVKRLTVNRRFAG